MSAMNIRTFPATDLWHAEGENFNVLSVLSLPQSAGISSRQFPHQVAQLDEHWFLADVLAEVDLLASRVWTRTPGPWSPLDSKILRDRGSREKNSGQRRVVANTFRKDSKARINLYSLWWEPAQMRSSPICTRYTARNISMRRCA